MKEDIKEILLMGLGAMSLTNSKAQDLKKELLDKGNELYETGKIKNEELKHDIEDKIKQNVTIVYNKDDMSKEELADKINSMSKEDKKEILDMLKGTKDKKDE